MDRLPSIHETASAYFLCKIANGAIPEQVAGGTLDGLRYFTTRIDGAEYWLTDGGLFDPGERRSSPQIAEPDSAL